MAARGEGGSVAVHLAAQNAASYLKLVTGNVWTNKSFAVVLRNSPASVRSAYYA